MNKSVLIGCEKPTPTIELISLIRSKIVVHEVNRRFFITMAGLSLLSVTVAAKAESFLELRQKMVETQIKAREISNEKVLHAMIKVDRHRFVPAIQIPYAYNDYPLPIGHNQTISQPYIVALMTELLDPKPNDVVLEVGTGSGYQAAILAEIVRHVFTIEIIQPLAVEARERLASLNYRNVSVKTGDGYLGWPEKSPFDGILVTAAASHVPPPLIEQLKPGGRLVIPIGSNPDHQELIVVKKNKDGSTTQRPILPVRFVPLKTGTPSIK